MAKRTHSVGGLNERETRWTTLLHEEERSERSNQRKKDNRELVVSSELEETKRKKVSRVEEQPDASRIDQTTSSGNRTLTRRLSVTRSLGSRGSSHPRAGSGGNRRFDGGHRHRDDFSSRRRSIEGGRDDEVGDVEAIGLSCWVHSV